jgi:hypothetical protein
MCLAGSLPLPPLFSVAYGHFESTNCDDWKSAKVWRSARVADVCCVIFCLWIRGDHAESPLKTKSAQGENTARTLLKIPTSNY